MIEYTVTFKLEKVMRMADVVKSGVPREFVNQLFTELQTKEFGVYNKIKGKRGSLFICGQDCPAEYTVTVSSRSKLTFKSQFVSTIGEEGEESTSKEEGEEPREASSFQKWFADKLSTPRGLDPNKLPLLTNPSNTGYVCTEVDGCVYLDRVLGRGFPSIDLAVATIWGSIKDRIDLSPMHDSSKIEILAGKLKGIPFVELTPNQE